MSDGDLVAHETWPPEAVEVVARAAESMRTLRTRVSQLEGALESRVVIEQAKGVLAERMGLELDEAFELLRYAARSNRIKLHALAEAVVSARTTPPELQRARVRLRQGAVA